MKLVDFLPKECFIPDLKSTTKKEAIQELVDLLVERKHIRAGQAVDVMDALMARESLGSTGIGRGIAVPHAAHEAVTRVVGAIGLSGRGIDFRSLDGQPADLLILILSPPDCPERIEALRLVSQFVMEHDLRRFLREAKDPETVQELLHEAETRLGISY